MTRLTTTLLTAILLLVGAFTFAASANVVLDFETAGQFADHFDELDGMSDQTTSNGAANDYHRMYRTTSSGGGKGSFIYNTDNDGTEDAKDLFGDITVAGDWRVSLHNAKAGFFLRGNDDRSDGFLVWLNAGGDEIVVAQADPSNGGSSGTTLSRFGKSTGLNENFPIGLTENDWIHLVVSIANVDVAGQPAAQITASAYKSTTTFDATTLLATGTYTAAINLLTDPGEIGLLALNGSNNNEINLDNFTIIPEPASLALLSLGGLVVARRRWTACRRA